MQPKRRYLQATLQRDLIWSVDFNAALAKRQEDRKVKAAVRLANSSEYTAEAILGGGAADDGEADENEEVQQSGGGDSEKGDNNGNA
eukprot:gene23903-30181_t